VSAADWDCLLTYLSLLRVSCISTYLRRNMFHVFMPITCAMSRGHCFQTKRQVLECCFCTAATAVPWPEGGLVAWWSLLAAAQLQLSRLFKAVFKYWRISSWGWFVVGSCCWQPICVCLPVAWFSTVWCTDLNEQIPYFCSSTFLHGTC